MNERAKITTSHLSRHAVVYLRQSSAAQVENNRESTDRQYALASKARDLGWPADRIIVIDEDLGLSASGSVARSGFARLTAEVALARVGLVLGLEVSRLARNNADWHRLIDLAGLSRYADRRCRRPLPSGPVQRPSLAWAEGHHERGRTACAAGPSQRRHSQQGSTRRAPPRSAGRPRLGRGRRRGALPPGRGRCHSHPQRVRVLRRDGFCSSCLAVVPLGRARLPAADALRRRDPLGRGELHRHPPCAHQPCLCRSLRLWQNAPGNDAGCGGRRAKKRIRHLPRSEWQVLIPEHHQGFIDWQTYEANQDRIARNTRPRPHDDPQQGRRRREGRQRAVTRPRLLRSLRSSFAHALSWAQARHRDIIVLAIGSSRAAGATASMSAASRSTRP